MKIEKLILGQSKTNCYVVSHERTAIVIDPAVNGEVIDALIKRNNCTVKAIFLTHGHPDHIGAVDYLYGLYKCPVYAHISEKDIITGEKPELVVSLPTLKNIKVTCPVKYFNNEFMSWDIDGILIDGVYTPGHSAGSCVYVLRNYYRIFTGDTLFKDGIGRVDLPTSDKVKMRESLALLKTFVDKCKVLPGHGDETTIGAEKANNNLF